MNRLSAAMLLFALVVSGCAVGNKYDYESQIPELAITSKSDISVSVQDQRPYVVSGDKTPQWVGMQRGGYGNPFGVHTASGDPLADDFADTIVKALKQRGITAKSLHTSPSLSSKPAIKALAASGSDKLLLVSLQEWKTDTYMNVALIYDVTAEVFDGQGRPIARNAAKGREDLGGDFVNPPGHAMKAVPPAYRRILETLLDSQQVINALE